MSKWFSAYRSSLVLSALILTLFFFIPSLSQAAQVTLTWDANDPAPDGYCIYYRTQGQAYDYSEPCWIGIDTTGTVDGLEANTMHYFVVRAYVAEQESADSNEVEYITSASDPCEPLAGDVNADGYVNFSDLAQLRTDFGKAGNPGWVTTDMNYDGFVNFADLAILRSQFGQSECTYP